MGTIVAALISAAVSVAQWLFGGKQQAAGVAQGTAEAQRDIANANAATEANIAKAEANAPKTDDEALKRLEAGNA